MVKVPTRWVACRASLELTVRAPLARAFTPRTILHLLADVFRHQAAQARATNQRRVYRRCRRVAHALLVIGLGIDAVWPR